MTGTIPELFEAAAAEAADRVWLRYEDEQYTYAQARARIGGAAAALAEQGVEKGDRVLIVAPNDPPTLFTWLAVTYLGAVSVATNPQQSRSELDGLRDQLDPKVVVEQAELAEEREPDGPGPAEPDDPAVMIPTSGTTGKSKLVTQTHRAYHMAGEGFPWWMELSSDDRLMTSLPLFHINAPAYSVLGSVAARGGLVLLPRFSASRFFDWAREHGATEFNAIGAMLEILMRQDERDDDADNPIRLVYTGPSPPEERQLEIEERFGLQIVCGYAMSESPYGMIWPRGERPFGTLGKPRQHPTLGHVNDARIVDGELQLRNPTVMLGYYGMQEESERVLLEDGWLRTGDLVEVDDDGYYTFLGRQKEVIRRRGENLSPAEVEEALASHADVHEAAVIGVPSDLSEEEVKAFVVVPEGADLAAIRDHAAERLTRFKVPRYIEVVDELPHTPTGRVAKHELTRDRTDDEVDFEA